MSLSLNYYLNYLSLIKVLAIAALLWMLVLWVCENMVFKVNIEVAVTSAVILCCLDTILHSVWWCLWFTFSFFPEIFFADEVLPCFVYAVIILKSVVLKTPTIRLSSLQMFLLKGLPWFAFRKSNKSPISSSTCTNHCWTQLILQWYTT